MYIQPFWKSCSTKVQKRNTNWHSRACFYAFAEHHLCWHSCIYILLLWKLSLYSNSSYMECLHSISLVVVKGLCSLNGFLSLLCLVFSFLYINLDSFLLLKGFFKQLRANCYPDLQERGSYWWTVSTLGPNAQCICIFTQFAIKLIN